MPNYSTISDDELWNQLKAHQDEAFCTSGRGSRKGTPFTYTIRGGEMFVSCKDRSISKSTVYRAYDAAVALQREQGYVKGPKALGIPGAGSYLFPIFIALGIITPITLIFPISTSETDAKREGRKSSIDERIAAAEKDVEMLTTQLRAKKAELKELSKGRAVAAKVEEDKLFAAVLASGKSVDEIIALIQQ